ncbi:MAG: iron-containing alcohol dehydrogenase [Clostridiales Family XIII bacterium]|jgi:alcohol dehydrogenase class IV|nr:iron-containing alcohol dehydrogenase [Clostridiales Family XIII bacterium]
MARIEMMEFGIMQRLFQGSGCLKKIVDILDNEGWKRVMLIADPYLYKAGVVAPVEECIKEAGAEYIVFTNVRPNPEVVTIEKEAIPAFKEFKADVIIAVGGGSTMDTAKGVVLVGDSDHGVMDFTIDKIRHDEKFDHKMPAMIALPTTAGTGSEVCRNAVICDESGLKLVPSHDSILPQYALMDPDLLAGMPFKVAAATSVDAFTHALETLTNTNANDFTRTFSLRALELIGESIRPFVANPAVPKWANMMSLGCMYAGFSLGLASIGQDHVITHPMSEDPFHMPHGDACGMALPPVIEYNGAGCKELYRQAYNAVTGKRLAPEEFEVQMLIDWVVDLNVDLRIADNKTFEEWGYNDGEVLELMLNHPIVQLGVRINSPNEQCEYPRYTSIDDYRDIIQRMNVYSKAQAERAKAKKTSV